MPSRPVGLGCENHHGTRARASRHQSDGPACGTAQRTYLGRPDRQSNGLIPQEEQQDDPERLPEETAAVPVVSDVVNDANNFERRTAVRSTCSNQPCAAASDGRFAASCRAVMRRRPPLHRGWASAARRARVQVLPHRSGGLSLYTATRQYVVQGTPAQCGQQFVLGMFARITRTVIVRLLQLQRGHDRADRAPECHPAREAVAESSSHAVQKRVRVRAGRGRAETE